MYMTVGTGHRWRSRPRGLARAASLELSASFSCGILDLIWNPVCLQSPLERPRTP